MASATRGHTVETKVKMQPSVEHSTEREISTPDVNTAVPTDGVEMSWIDPPLRQQHSTTARQQAAAAAVTPLPSNVKLSKSTWPHITCQRFLFSGGVGSVFMNTISSIGSSEKVGRWTKAEGGGWGGGSYLAAGVSSPENFWNDGCTSVWYQLHRQSAVKLPRGGGDTLSKVPWLPIREAIEGEVWRRVSPPPRKVLDFWCWAMRIGTSLLWRHAAGWVLSQYDSLRMWNAMSGRTSIDRVRVLVRLRLVGCARTLVMCSVRNGYRAALHAVAS